MLLGLIATLHTYCTHTLPIYLQFTTLLGLFGIVWPQYHIAHILHKACDLRFYCRLPPYMCCLDSFPDCKRNIQDLSVVLYQCTPHLSGYSCCFCFRPMRTWFSLWMCCPAQGLPSGPGLSGDLSSSPPVSHIFFLFLVCFLFFFFMFIFFFFFVLCSFSASFSSFSSPSFFSSSSFSSPSSSFSYSSSASLSSSSSFFFFSLFSFSSSSRPFPCVFSRERKKERGRDWETELGSGGEGGTGWTRLEYIQQLNSSNELVLGDGWGIMFISHLCCWSVCQLVNFLITLFIEDDTSWQVQNGN